MEMYYNLRRPYAPVTNPECSDLEKNQNLALKVQINKIDNLEFIRREKAKKGNQYTAASTKLQAGVIWDAGKLEWWCAGVILCMQAYDNAIESS